MGEDGLCDQLSSENWLWDSTARREAIEDNGPANLHQTHNLHSSVKFHPRELSILAAILCQVSSVAGRRPFPVASLLGNEVLRPDLTGYTCPQTLPL